MVRVGEVYWVARVEGQGKASAAAQELQDDMGEVADTSEKAAAAQNTVGENTDETSDKVESATRATGIYRTAQGLLSSTLYFAAGQTAAMTAATKAYALAAGLASKATAAWSLSLGALSAAKAGLLSGLSTLLGYGSAFVSWLAAGSAGALAFAGAIGAGVGMLGVWILDTLGALDAVQQFGGWVRNVLPGWVADGLNMLLSVAVGPLAVFGGFIVGFIRGGFDEAFKVAGQVVDSFLGSWERNIARLQSLWDSGTAYLGKKWNQFTGYLGEKWNGATGWVRKKWNQTTGFLSKKWDQFTGFFRNKGQSAVNFVSGSWDSFKSKVFGVIDGIIGKLQGLIDTAKKAADAIPGSDIAGDIAGGAGGFASSAMSTGGDIVGGAADFVGLDSGGRILESGVAEVHKGEAVIPRPLVEAAERGAGRVGNMAQDTVTVEAQGQAGGGGGGDTAVENTYDISVGDQSLDLSNLSRSDLRTLARLIGEELGEGAGNIAGGG